jgi:hypothetical protein
MSYKREGGAKVEVEQNGGKEKLTRGRLRGNTTRDQRECEEGKRPERAGKLGRSSRSRFYITAGGGRRCSAHLCGTEGGKGPKPIAFLSTGSCSVSLCNRL